MSTREELLNEYLAAHLIGDSTDTSLEVSDILAIADNRKLVSMAGFSKMIGRPRTTINSWIQRGNVTVPAPAYVSDLGPLWDLEDIERFRVRYPRLLRSEQDPS